MSTFSDLTQALQAASQSGRGITYLESRDAQTSVSYQDLQQRALAILAILQERGLEQGDEHILFLKDNQSFIEMFWTCLLGGIVPVPVAPGISDEHRAKLFKIFARLERPHLYTDSAGQDRLRQFATGQGLDFSRMEASTILVEDCAGASVPGKPATIRPDDTAFIQFSSGSTSDPKGVVLSHRNITSNIAGIMQAGQFTQDDISLSWMPLTHDMGLIGFHLNMLACAMQQYLMPTELFSRRPLLWLQKASESRASILCSPNFGYRHFLKALGDRKLDDVDLSAVRLIYNGAEPISISLCEEFMQRMSEYGLPQNSMYTVYGLAEASLAVSFPTPGAAMQVVHIDRRQLGIGQAVNLLDATTANAVSFAVEGRPVPGCRLRITDEANRPLAEMQVGLVQIRGENVTAGYYHDETNNATARSEDGWLNTGDLGFMSNGDLVITGRFKDIIFAHGLNYYPHDIEAIALGAEGTELGKVVVYGARKTGDEEDELLVFVLYRQELESFLPMARQIRHVINQQTGLEVSQVIPVNRIPKTTSGKVQRRLLGDAWLAGEYDDVIAQMKQRHDQQNRQQDINASSMESRLKTIVDAVVSDKDLGIHENFFDSGISSLALAEIHQRIDDEWPDMVDVVDLFEYQTIAEVAGFLEQKLAQG